MEHHDRITPEDLERISERIRATSLVKALEHTSSIEAREEALWELLKGIQDWLGIDSPGLPPGDAPKAHRIVKRIRDLTWIQNSGGFESAPYIENYMRMIFGDDNFGIGDGT